MSVVPAPSRRPGTKGSRLLPLLALSGPLMILLSLVAMLHRRGPERIQALPALLIGTGLLITSALQQRRRRRELLLSLRKEPRQG